jgi:hypothetical protein
MFSGLAVASIALALCILADTARANREIARRMPQYSTDQHPTDVYFKDEYFVVARLRPSVMLAVAGLAFAGGFWWQFRRRDGMPD